MKDLSFTAKKMKTIGKASIIILFSVSCLAQDGPKSFQNRIETTASPSDLWTVWTDVSSWKNWDTGLKDASLEGDFKVGARGKIISLGGRSARFQITEIDPNRSYTFKTKLPFCSMYIRRYSEKIEGNLFFTHQVWFKGLASGYFFKQLGPEFKRMLPQVMENVKNLAEK